MTRDELVDAIQNLKLLVEDQADDEGLWFIAQTCPEAYLQEALRALHEAIEKLPTD